MLPDSVMDMMRYAKELRKEECFYCNEKFTIHPSNFIEGRHFTCPGCGQDYVVEKVGGHLFLNDADLADIDPIRSR